MNSAIVSICSVVIAALSLTYSAYKDQTRKAKEDGKTSYMLGEIKKRLDELHETQTRYEGRQEKVLERLARVEESAKQAHKRIDEINKKIEPDDGKKD